MTADPLVSENVLRCVVVGTIVSLALITLAAAACSRWGADWYETPPVYDRATRQWDVTETSTLGRDGLPGRHRPAPGGAPHLPQVDHRWCEAHLLGQCNRLVCVCPATDGLPCPGTVELGCDHDVTLCDQHAADLCVECQPTAVTR